MIVGTNRIPDPPGLFVVDVALIVPPAYESGYVPRMLEICQEHRIDLLMSLHDVEVMILSQHLDEFKAMETCVLGPDATSYTMFLDKYAGNRYLREQGLCARATFFDFTEAASVIADGTLTLPSSSSPGADGIELAFHRGCTR